MAITKISSKVFVSRISSDSEGVVKWHEESQYISCDCYQFKFIGRCPHAEEVKELLDKKGKKVKFKRVLKPMFIEDINTFVRKLKNSNEIKKYGVSKEF